MDNMKLPATATVLYGAIKILEKEGWCRGAYHDNQDRRCAAGAITESGKRLGLDPVPALQVMVERLQGRGYTNIPDWNDRPFRTQGSVVRELSKAAEFSVKYPGVKQGESLLKMMFKNI